MKFARFTTNHDHHILQGVVTETGIQEVNGDIFSNWKLGEKIYKHSEVGLLAPIVPRHIIGIGINYVAKEEDLPDELPEIPVFFYKPASSVIASDEKIVIPSKIDEVKFEAELAVVIGKKTKEITEDEATSHIFGYTVANDVTAPQFFREDGHWAIGKSYDTFTPLGPYIETELDPDQVQVTSYLNGEMKQNSRTTLMIVSMRKMISYLSNVMTLDAGDVILTGSPLGAVMMKQGDEIVCEIEEIGQLRNIAQ